VGGRPGAVRKSLTQHTSHEIVENAPLSDVLRKTPVENQWFMSGDAQVLRCFDRLNEGMQATASSIRLRLAPAIGRGSPRAFGANHGGLNTLKEAEGLP
jgi:hypothetical protein